MRCMLWLLLTILIISPANAIANSSDEDSSIVEYNQDGLGLLFVLTNSEQFFVDWAKPEPPLITTVISANRGDSIFPVVLFGTDAADENGNASLTYDITILKPDGAVYGEYSDLIVCKDQPADNIHLHLLAQPIMIRIEETDPYGNYAVNIVVHEKNKGVSVPLSQSFVVKEARIVRSTLDTLTSIRSQEDLSLFMEEYYYSPRPDLVSEALSFISDSGSLGDKNFVPPFHGFFSQVFHQIGGDPKPWVRFAEQHSSIKDFVLSAIEASISPKEAFRKEPLTPSLIDIYWGAFFASGDVYFVREITKHLRHLDERNDIWLYVTASTAEWSLSSNARTRPRVEADLLLIQKTSTPDIARRIESLLKRSPVAIQQEMTDVIKEQMEKGIWK